MYIYRGHRLQFPENVVFFSLKIDVVLANSADPDEMPPYAAFFMGLHCMPKNMFRGFRSTNGYTYFI